MGVARDGGPQTGVIRDYHQRSIRVPQQGHEMSIRPNRTTERAAVNAVQAFFESCNCIFQPVALENDFGKDAYVDMSKDNQVTGLCVALQIKGGDKYKRSEGYAIPLDAKHAALWRDSTLPVVGIVHDPHKDKLFWCNISQFLTAASGPLPSSIPVSESNELTADSLARFEQDIRTFTATGAGGRVLLELVEAPEGAKGPLLLDCFAFGRSDPRVLVVLRYLLPSLRDDSLLLAITVLSHVTPHPDIFWHANNWIPEEARQRIRPHLQWTEDEILRLLDDVPWERWQRGSQGQDLYMLLKEDRDIECKMERVAVRALHAGTMDAAFAALYLVIYWAGAAGAEKLAQMVQRDHRFKMLSLHNELVSCLHDSGGYVCLFE